MASEQIELIKLQKFCEQEQIRKIRRRKVDADQVYNDPGKGSTNRQSRTRTTETSMQSGSRGLKNKDAGFQAPSEAADERLKEFIAMVQQMKAVQAEMDELRAKKTLMVHPSNMPALPPLKN